MDLKERFEQAAADSKTLSQKPGNDVLLKLYSLYKQGALGDVNTDPPSNPFDIVGKAKYEAWASLKGKSRDDAMNEDISLVEALKSGG